MCIERYWICFTSIILSLIFIELRYWYHIIRYIFDRAYNFLNYILRGLIILKWLSITAGNGNQIRFFFFINFPMKIVRILIFLSVSTFKVSLLKIFILALMTLQNTYSVHATKLYYKILINQTVLFISTFFLSLENPLHSSLRPPHSWHSKYRGRDTRGERGRGRELIAGGTNWTREKRGRASNAAERLRDYGLIRIN